MRELSGDPRKTLEKQESRNLVYFASNFIRYFFTHGVYADQLTGSLYRGYNQNFVLPLESTLKEKGFIATSKSLGVANKFAGDMGTIIRLRVEDLPDKVPVVLIDERLASYLMEEEVVLLPGTLEFTKQGKYMHAEYKVNMDLVNAFKDIHVEMRGGDVAAMEKDTSLDLCNKYIIFWRTIEKHPVQMMSYYRLPSNANDVQEKLQKIITPQDILLNETLMRWTPEYQDMLKKRQSKHTSLKESRRLYRRMRSFWTHMAIIDPVTETIDTLHYGVWDDWFNEMFAVANERREEVERYIMSQYRGYVHLTKPL